MLWLTVPEKEAVKEKDPTEDPKVAARMNLFGRLTHISVEWHPDKLLCKRFNIKDPYPEYAFNYNI
jgi:G patch domain-containing protein 1